MPALLFLGLTLEEVSDEASTVATYRKAIDLAEAQRGARECRTFTWAVFYYQRNRWKIVCRLSKRPAEINPRSAEAQLQLGKSVTRNHEA
jgi:hypothetical protein